MSASTLDDLVHRLRRRIDVVLQFGAEDISDLELLPVERVDELEHVVIRHYCDEIRVTAPDLLHVAQALKFFAEDLITHVDDARLQRRIAGQHPCSCGETLDEDEITCGTPACIRRHDAEVTC